MLLCGSRVLPHASVTSTTKSLAPKQVSAGGEYRLLKETIHTGVACKHWWNPDYSPMLVDGRMSLCLKWPSWIQCEGVWKEENVGE